MLVFLMASLLPSNAAEADLRAIIAKFAAGTGFAATEAVVRELAATGDPRSNGRLAALADGNLYVRKADQAVFVGNEAGDSVALLDPLSGESAGEAAKADINKIKVNNGLRGAIRDALGTLTLRAEGSGRPPRCRRDHVQDADAANIEPLDAAIAAETDAKVKALFEQARAASVLVSDKPEADKLAAIALIGARGDRDALSLLTSVEANAQGAVKDAATRGNRQHQFEPGALGCRPEHLVRHLARLGAAARRHRPCHHLRRHGRHQHGAWRDGDARRLHHLRRAGGDPHLIPRPVRLVAGRSRCRSPSWSPLPSA